jgi:hypothetical protein
MIPMLCAKAQDLLMRYGPQHSICLCAMGRSAGFAYALWAIVQNFFLSYGL